MTMEEMIRDPKVRVESDETGIVFAFNNNKSYVSYDIGLRSMNNWEESILSFFIALTF